MATAAERLKQYEDLFQRSQGYDTAKYQQDFEKAYNEAANYNKDLIEQKAGYISQAQALPSQMREQYYTSPIRNPLAQEALIATRRGALTGDVNRIVDLLAARGARYQDVLGKHLSAYESEAQRAATAAENAWRLYQDAQAQEEAARARAAARAAAQSFDLASLLQQPTGGDGGGNGGGNGGGGGYVEVGPVQKALNWTDKVYGSDWLGADLTKAPTSGWSALLKAAQLANPLTYIKTGAGLLGNLIGNRGTNKSFLNKLLNR